MAASEVPPSNPESHERAMRYVLFVCNHNAGRSQIAQAFFERYGPEDVPAESAGTEPAREIWPSAGKPIGEVRAIRNGIQAHVRELIGARLEAIQTRECLRRDTCDLLASRERS